MDISRLFIGTLICNYASIEGNRLHDQLFFASFLINIFCAALKDCQPLNEKWIIIFSIL